MPIPEIIKFREKYPDYSDIDDATLASKLAEKYPDAYGDLPSKVQQTTPATSIQQEQPQPTGWDALKSAWAKRAGNIKQIDQYANSGSTLDRYINSPGYAVKTLGQIAGFGGDIMGQAIEAGMPEGAKKDFAWLAQTEPAKVASMAIKDVKEKFPVASDMATDFSNIFGFIPAGKGAQAGTKMLNNADVLKGVTPGKIVNAVHPSPTPKEALGQILQGKSKDLVRGERALATIDPQGIKTYADLKTKLDETIPKYVQAVDQQLAKDPKLYKLDELSTVAKTTGGNKVSQNFVEKALNHLNELYTKIEDPVGAKEIEELINKASNKGLTKIEINNIARKYNAEFGDKAFKGGEQLTSVNAQAYENIRRGVKEVSRRGMDETVKHLDEITGSIYNTRRLIDKNVEAVNKLRQRVDQRGLGEKIGRLAWDAFDLATFGTAKGALLKLMPRGMGYKVKNAINLEESLKRNLKIVNKALEAKTDGELLNIIRNPEVMNVEDSLYTKALDNLLKKTGN
jgi:hypothetical protein